MSPDSSQVYWLVRTSFQWNRALMTNSNPGPAKRWRMLLLVAGFIVLSEQVYSEIAFVIAPYGMDVIGVVLRVVVFDQEGRRLDAVVVRIAFFKASGPRE